MFRIESHELIYVLRILIAGICGIIIGIERKNRSKEAGIRTHFVVSCGAALIMIVSKYAFFDLSYSADFKFDPSRVASTIASGIGFLGAGMIFVHKNTISGLTTAAGIWATAGVGMAIGAGMIFIGVSATFLILLAQLLLHMERINRKTISKKISIKDVSERNFQKEYIEKLKNNGIAVHGISVEKSVDGKMNYTFIVDLPRVLNEEDVAMYTEYKTSIKNDD